MTADLWVGMVALGLMFAAEGWLPADPERPARFRHGGQNLILAVAGGAAGALLAPWLMFTANLAQTHELGLCAGLRAWLGPAAGLADVVCLLVALVVFDFWMYIWHRANHRLPLLWRFHRVHHTDTAMDSTTALRFHPGEILLSALANGFVFLLIGMSFAGFVLYKALMIVVILFHHSNLQVSPRLDRRLRTILVTPAMHRVHHSEIRAETDSNYGTLFSFWDRLFGSFRLRADTAAIRFGIGRFGEAAWQRPLGLLALPFVGETAPEQEASG